MANPGDRLSYRVVPMIGPDKANLRVDTTNASDWTPEITLSREVSKDVEVYFNRGIVAAQWVSRRMNVTAADLKPDPNTADPLRSELAQIIETPGNALRDYLTGPLGSRLFELLAQVAKESRDIYGALYELDDPQLLDCLELIGMRAHIVLANGSVKKKGLDQNEEARTRLTGKIDLHDRMTSPRALAHNKFLVICDTAGDPRWVWTGSQNWTSTGLCGQANNSVLIDSPELAKQYRLQWDLLKDAGAASPESLKVSSSKSRVVEIGNDSPAQSSSATLWFTPTIGEVDLDEARTVIQNAKDSILFLMFNPGPKGSLLNEIIAAAERPDGGKTPLYIKGAINQDPSTKGSPVKLFDQANQVGADFNVVLPAAIDNPTEWFVREITRAAGAIAMVHSKVIVVDATSDHPIVMTGSHNLGPKASGTNDENLLIIRDDPGLAGAYATNIMSIYNQYRWRYNRLKQTNSTSWKGLKDNQYWQPWYWSDGDDKARYLREMEFWVSN